VNLSNEVELANTREKLRELEARYETRQREVANDSRAHALTLQSLKRMINQLKEEIARYETRSVLRN
jgi:hypothetical protein